MPLLPLCSLDGAQGNGCPSKARASWSLEGFLEVDQGQNGEDAVLGVVGQANLQAVQVLGGIDESQLERGAFGIVDEADVGQGIALGDVDRPQLSPFTLLVRLTKPRLRPVSCPSCQLTALMATPPN
jgi:hypothetical protein